MYIYTYTHTHIHRHRHRHTHTHTHTHTHIYISPQLHMDTYTRSYTWMYSPKKYTYSQTEYSHTNIWKSPDRFDQLNLRLPNRQGRGIKWFHHFTAHCASLRVDLCLPDFLICLQAIHARYNMYTQRMYTAICMHVMYIREVFRVWQIFAFGHDPRACVEKRCVRASKHVLSM